MKKHTAYLFSIFFLLKSYILTNPPDGEFFLLFKLTGLYSLIYGMILFLTIKRIKFSIIIVHFISFIIFSTIGMFIRDERLQEMGGMLYAMIPTSEIVIVLFGLLINQLFKKILGKYVKIFD